MKILAFDQSYSNIGFSVQENGELFVYGSFKIENFKNKVVKRAFIKALAKGLSKLYNVDMVIIEQVRMFNKGFAKLKPIMDLSEMIGCVCDAVYPRDIYAVDSRSWKSKVIGNPSADKEDAVKFIKEKYNIDVDHDTADAICLSLYPDKHKAILNRLD